MEKYKYIGPDMYVQPVERGFKVLLTSGESEYLDYANKVKAEVNINIATIKSVFQEHFGYWMEIEPVYVAAKYMEPVKPKIIHFDPKDDELERKPFNIENFFNELNESYEKFPLFGDDSVSQGWDKICQRAWKKKYGDTYYTPKKVMDYIREHGKEKVNGDEFHMVSKDETKKHYKPEDGSSWTAEILAGLHNKHDNDHEVGGNHYKMAIEPWDYIHIVQELTDTYKAKNHDYGNSFADLFSECGMPYAYGHLKEKLNRIKSLMSKEAEVKSENMVDSLMDLANYAILTIMELRKEGKC